MSDQLQLKLDWSVRPYRVGRYWGANILDNNGRWTGDCCGFLTEKEATDWAWRQIREVFNGSV